MYTEPKESERKYQRLAKLGKELGVPVPQCFIETEVTMPDGKVFRNKTRSHSWKRNMYNFIFCLVANKNPTDVTVGAGLLSFKSSAGAVIHGSMLPVPGCYYNSTPVFISGDAPGSGADAGYNAEAAVDTYGILVGTSDTAETFDDCALITKVAHGNTSGKLAIQATNPHVVAYDSGSKTLSDTLSRFFNNNSGGDITIKEVAIYSIIVNGYNNTPSVLMSRDVLVTPVLVPNTGQLKVSYTNSLVYPA